ncbi:MAG: hypothetical protein HFG68_12830 [Hungatella sp.]|nr:hypothetical protein [Hungatella sp.]
MFGEAGKEASGVHLIWKTVTRDLCNLASDQKNLPWTGASYYYYFVQSE